MHHARGFTLIETIVYIALFALMLTTVVLAVFQVLQGSAQVNGRATIQDEENFVLRKIDWALGSIDPTKAFTPSVGYSTTLSLTRYGDSQPVIIRINGTKVEMSEDGGTTYLPITTGNVTVTQLGFGYIAPTGTGPAGITASTTISGLVASTTKYIRN
ncbi:MAG: prepilin-type N-terminal cleavage/methylation domain-containing protein [Candidatus Sungbacteria bacterium]|uniref:Prepilin-type N-terminal cleavage/methylation domain-containing protein n=1 Tax=Candidatus Sungiibacteriota bacterium TaxID=2750080 RepID=A0A932QYL2_9BACT|nr:prepilin-type N-terminal cleavage/methylation domain-containing protein [Candidatus Sungbacteria bacterium]